MTSITYSATKFDKYHSTMILTISGDSAGKMNEALTTMFDSVGAVESGTGVPSKRTFKVLKAHIPELEQKIKELVSKNGVSSTLEKPNYDLSTFAINVMLKQCKEYYQQATPRLVVSPSCRHLQKHAQFLTPDRPSNKSIDIDNIKEWLTLASEVLTDPSFPITHKIGIYEGLIDLLGAQEEFSRKHLSLTSTATDIQNGINQILGVIPENLALTLVSESKKSPLKTEEERDIARKEREKIYTEFGKLQQQKQQFSIFNAEQKGNELIKTKEAEERATILNQFTPEYQRLRHVLEVPPLGSLNDDDE